MTSAEAYRRPWRSPEILGVGEAMVEFAPVGDSLYRRGFAGDTLNTCWHLAHLLGASADVAYATRVGRDAFSDQLVDFLAASGLDASRVQRDPERSLGLYVITLTGAERSFSYWRETSAARRLADDLDVLRESMRTSALIHVSGITLAVIGETGRRNLLRALAEARAAGAVISFDPNVRLRLWPDLVVLRTATQAMLEIADIALPSFDDEALVWGDAAPEASIARIAACGVEEIVVKNGAGEAALRHGAVLWRSTPPRAKGIVDTTGAGDAFNAGYLAGRFADLAPMAACAVAQGVAEEVIGCFGALAPAAALARHRESLGIEIERPLPESY